MKQNIVSSGFLVRLIFVLTLIALLYLISSRTANAQSPSDYYQFEYNISLSQTQITGSQPFTIAITGKATSINDLPLPVSEAKLEVAIIAQHTTSGKKITLNPGYTVLFKPLPSKKGDPPLNYETSLTLQFPSGSEAGVYDIVGVLNKAEVVAVITVNVLNFLPDSLKSKSAGSVNYTPAAATPPPSTSIPPGKAASPPRASLPLPAPALVPPVMKELPALEPATGGLSIQTTIQTDDKKAILVLPVGTKATAPDGNHVTKITITPLSAPQAPLPAGKALAAAVYDFGPKGTTFNPPVDLTLTYDPSSLPTGFSESSLKIAFFEDGDWKELDSLVDPVNKVIAAKVPHFTEFTVVAFTSAPTPMLSPEPTPASFMPSPEVRSSPGPIPGPIQEENPVKGLDKSLLIVIATLIAASYTFFKLRRKGAGV